MATTSRVRRASSCSGLSTGIAAMVVQFGLAIIPSGGFSASSGLTSLTTSGTWGSARQAEELSTTTAPAAATCGAYCRLVVAPAEKIAMSIPEKSACAVSSTTCRVPATSIWRPAERAEANSRSRSIGNLRCCSRVSITPPT